MTIPKLFMRCTGRGRPIVLLGGCPTAWDALAPLARAISTTAKAIEMALPGYGESPPLSPYTMARAHEAIEETLLADGIDECAFVGFSAGAYRALAIGCRGRVRVTHVLSLGGLAALSPEEAAAQRGFAAAARAGVDMKGLPTQRFLSPAFATENPDVCREVESWLTAAPTDVLAAELEALAEAEDLSPALGALRAQVVCRVGALDLATPPAKSEAIVKACPSARLEIVPNAGHALLYEDEAGTIASLRRLVAR